MILTFGFCGLPVGRHFTNYGLQIRDGGTGLNDHAWISAVGFLGMEQLHIFFGSGHNRIPIAREQAGRLSVYQTT
jgi:hypothetical protein